MTKYIVKRILLIIPILFMVIFIVYFIMDLMPGSPATIILGENATIEDINRLNEELGYNKSFFERFFIYVKDLVTTGSFGTSWRTSRPVLGEVLKRLPVSFNLALLGVILSAAIGIPLGVVSAVKQYSVLDNVSRITAMLLAAFPSFWLGMILVLVFSLRMHILPAAGINTPAHYILPVITIALPQAASLLRFSRSTMLETIRQDYIRTARAKGNSEMTVVIKHALRNALLPIITVLGNTFGQLMGGIVTVEAVFGIPGMGQFAMNSILMQDVPQVMAAVIVLAAIFCLIMLVVDILYALVDPRVKAMYTSARPGRARARKI